MQKTVPLKRVRPNPFRKMERYPIRKEKIAMLVDSMGRTGFWDNVVGREQNGFIELAYGHHRWIAYRKKFGEQSKIKITVRNLSDEDMLRVMADENASEYGTSAEVEQETIRAIVEAYAEGKIELWPEREEDGTPVIHPQTRNLRSAPSFQSGFAFKTLKREKFPYNAESIARFLGWMSGRQVSPRVRNALAALEAMEEGLVPREAMEGLTSTQAEEISREAILISRSHDQAAKATTDPKQQKELKTKGKKKARDAASRAAKSMKPNAKTGKNKATVKQVKEEMRKSRAKKPEEVPRVEVFVSKLTKDLDKTLGPGNPQWIGLSEVAKHRDSIDKDTKKNLTVVLNRIIDRCQAMIDAIEGESPKLKGRKRSKSHAKN